MKKVLITIIAIIMCLSLVACGSSKVPAETSPSASNAGSSEAPNQGGEKVRILYAAKNLADPFHSWLSNMTTQYLEENYPDVEFTVMDLMADSAKTQEAVDLAMVDGYDGLILDKPSSAQDTNDMVAELDKEGIKVTLINTNYKVQDDGFSSTSGASNEDLGFAVGEIAAELLPQKAKVLVILGAPGNIGSDDRWKGYQAALAGRTDIEYLEVRNNENWAKETAMKVMDDWCQVYPEIDAVIGMNDGMTLGCIEAARADGRDVQKMQFFGIDGLGDACLSIKAGELTGSVLQDANDMGAWAAQATYEMITKGNAREEHLIKPLKIIVDNVEDVIKIHQETGAIK